jgi:hypothetical protein
MTRKLTTHEALIQAAKIVFPAVDTEELTKRAIVGGELIADCLTPEQTEALIWELASWVSRLRNHSK